ncbi:hypothetical protein CGCVW01_v009463 [Colletotrichum viniferum]|nr:hypothetical protein CGCVW01_v009463 [Colletotrichum viniferum]
MSCHILTLSRIDEFLIHYEFFYYIGGRGPWTPDLWCRTSLLPYVDTLSIPYISPPDRFARIFSDFSNVRLFLIQSQCRHWPNFCCTISTSSAPTASFCPSTKPSSQSCRRVPPTGRVSRSRWTGALASSSSAILTRMMSRCFPHRRVFG